jgi:mono/diheme cytochrome c family protein
VLLATSAVLVACPRGTSATADAGAAPDPTASTGADFRRGWTLYQAHCAECHGDTRHGDGERAAKLDVRPANLRDPLLLANRTDDQLAKAIGQGGAFVGKSKAMPAFHAELSERDLLDLIAFLRGDAISLEDCFPDAALWAPVTLPDGPEPVLLAYAPDHPRPGTTRMAPGDPVHLAGLALFAEVTLPRAGATPVALLVNPSGDLLGVRVGLPHGDREKAQRDLEAGLRSGTASPLAATLGRLSTLAKGRNR